MFCIFSPVQCIAWVKRKKEWNKIYEHFKDNLFIYFFLLDVLGEPKIDLNYGKRSKKYVEERISRAKKRLGDVIADEFDLEPSTLTSFEEDYNDVIKVGSLF